MATALTSLSQVLSSLSQLQAREKQVSTHLAELVSNHETISKSLARLSKLTPVVDELQVDAKLLQTKVISTAKTADRVGGRVRTLDEEMRRIRDAAERVGQVVELKVRLPRVPRRAFAEHTRAKSSLAALYDAIDRGDWEAAARHCARVMAIPHDVLSGQFAAVAVVRVYTYALSHSSHAPAHLRTPAATAAEPASRTRHAPLQLPNAL